MVTGLSHPERIVMGEVFLVFLERRMGLAVVQAEWLAMQPSGEPAAVSEAQ